MACDKVGVYSLDGDGGVSAIEFLQGYDSLPEVTFCVRHSFYCTHDFGQVCQTQIEHSKNNTKPETAVVVAIRNVGRAHEYSRYAETAIDLGLDSMVVGSGLKGSG